MRQIRAITFRSSCVVSFCRSYWSYPALSWLLCPARGLLLLDPCGPCPDPRSFESRAAASNEGDGSGPLMMHLRQFVDGCSSDKSDIT